MHLSSRISLDNDAQVFKSLLDQVFKVELFTRRLVVNYATSRSPLFASSYSASRISPNSNDRLTPLARQDILFLLYRRVQSKLTKTTTKSIILSHSNSPVIGVLPQPEDLILRDMNIKLASIENTDRAKENKWMEARTGMNTEGFLMDMELDSITKNGQDAWENWERLIGVIFKC